VGGSSAANPSPGEQLRQHRQAKAQQRIWYKFNEGFSNAVRKTLHIKDFL